MLDQDIRDRIIQMETRLAERSREAQAFRNWMTTEVQALHIAADVTNRELSRLSDAFEAHKTADRHLLSVVNGNGKQRLVSVGLGTGFGGGVVAAVITIGQALGWF